MVRNWQTEDGLPQNSITDILQTRDGYLWLGTFNGLVRFHGFRFTTFNVARYPEMGSDSIVCLYEDRQGQLWIGTDGGGLTRFRQGEFTNYALTNRPGAAVVSSITEDKQVVLWVATDGGLLRFANARAEIYEPASLPEGFGAVSTVCCDEAGRIWIAAERGLFMRTEGVLIPFLAEVTGKIASRPIRRWQPFEKSCLHMPIIRYL